jgi:hypothetical protein
VCVLTRRLFAAIRQRGHHRRLSVRSCAHPRYFVVVIIIIIIIIMIIISIISSSVITGINPSLIVVVVLGLSYSYSRSCSVFLLFHLLLFHLFVSFLLF